MWAGSDLCAQLRTAGFNGVILIRSGNDSSSDEDYYKRHGADGLLTKTAQAASLVGELRKWEVIARERAALDAAVA